MNDQADRAAIDKGAELYCPECHYDLRGIDSARCPECGADADREGLRAVKLPWARRRQIGRVRAYIKTWWLASFRVHRLAGEMEHPIGWADSLRFRWITVAIAAVPVLAGLVLGHLALDDQASITLGLVYATLDAVADAELWRYLLGAAGSLVVSAVAAVLLLLMATGVAGWFLHPAALPVKRQNRAGSLGNYLCAPLALLVPGLFVLPLQVWLNTYPTGGWLGNWLPVLAIQALRGVILSAVLALTIGPFVLMHVNTLLLMRFAAGARMRRIAVAGLLLLLIWPALAFVCFAGLHALVTFAVLVIRHSTP